MRKNFDVVLIEGAGGLLSPLGKDFNSRDLMAALRALPVIAAPNKLGAVNQIMLTLEALPKNLRASARTVLVTPPKPDAATRSNTRLLEELFVQHVHRLPWLGTSFSAADVLQQSRAAKLRSRLRMILPRALTA
jgi:dethiobiotin synthetase